MSTSPPPPTPDGLRTTLAQLRRELAADLALLRGGPTLAPLERRGAELDRFVADLDAQLERKAIAGYAYGESSIFHVYFEMDAAAVAAAGSREDLVTSDPVKLKGLPSQLLSEYTRHLRHHGMDIMSGTGGVVSAVHTPEDIAEACEAFERTVSALVDLKLVHTLG